MSCGAATTTRQTQVGSLYLRTVDCVMVCIWNVPGETHVLKTWSPVQPCPEVGLLRIDGS